VEKPLITTGAGDHFNSGFCLGKVLGLDNADSLLAGVTASGFYVRSGHSPSLDDLAKMLRNWLMKNDFTDRQIWAPCLAAKGAVYR